MSLCSSSTTELKPGCSKAKPICAYFYFLSDVSQNLRYGKELKVQSTQPISQSTPLCPPLPSIFFFFKQSAKWYFSCVSILPNQETHHFCKRSFPSLDTSALLKSAFAFCQSAWLAYSTVTKSLISCLYYVPITSQLGSAPHRFPSGTRADGEAPLRVTTGLTAKEKRWRWMARWSYSFHFSLATQVTWNPPPARETSQR